MKAIKVFVVLAVALGLVGCSNSPAATPVSCSGTGSPINCVPTVNGRRIDQVRSCDSIVGQVLTKADETTICALPDGTIETPNVTVCAPDLTYINFGLNPSVSGLEGQKATKQTVDWALDRTTCELTPLATPFTESPSTTPVSGSTTGPDILNPQGVGWTFKLSDPTPFGSLDSPLTVGTYRLAWWAPGCSQLYVGITTNGSSDPHATDPASLPGGQRLITVSVEAPAGMQDSSVCQSGDVTVRFDKMP